MAVDPYVPVRPEDSPRAAVVIPPARPWRAVRPGDLGPVQPSAELMGSPGPDQGYALVLAEHFADRVQVEPPETVHDALVAGAALAMRRASMFGRAPVMPDLEVGLTLLGYLGGASPEMVNWRRLTLAGVGHDYPRLRAVVDAVPAAVLRRPPSEVAESLTRWREIWPEPLPGADDAHNVVTG
jgi:hypothetical protein